MSRAHLFRPLRDSEGNLKPSAVVSLFNANTRTKITQPIYTTPTGTTVLANPFTATLGVIDIYLDNPDVVAIEFTPSGDPPTYVDYISVLPPAHEVVRSSAAALRIVNTAAPGQILQATLIEGEAKWADIPATQTDIAAHEHDGDGLNSTQVGTTASALADGVAVGDGSAAAASGVAVGRDADTTDQQAVAIGALSRATAFSVAVGYDAGSVSAAQFWVAIGYQADATGTGGVAVGSQTVAAANAVAIGASAQATGADGIAIGRGAKAQNVDAVAIGPRTIVTHARSVALGADAATTADDQIMLGTAAHTVVVPGRLNATGGETRVGGATGRVGFFGTPPTSRPLVTGARGGNAALANLLVALDALGLIEDATTA